MKLPREWRTVRISEFGKVVTGNTPPTGDESNFGGPIPFVTPGDMGSPGSIQRSQRTLSIRGSSRARLVPAGSTLVVCIGSTIGKVGLAGTQLATNQQINAVVPADNVDGRFAFYEIGRVASTIRRLAGTQAVPIVSKGDFEDFPATLPPLPEQQKIADILGTWDEALEKLDALIAAKTRRKQALMQQLLTGQRRLLGFDESKGRVETTRHGTYPADWSRVRLGEITIESVARAANITEAVVLSCTKHRGLVPSEEYFGKRVYAADTSGYKVVRRGEFAYATNHIEEGSIGYQDVCDVGLVSPIYTVFRSRETLEDRYLFRLLKSSILIHLYQVNTSASVDRRGSLRYGEFANIKVNLPAKPEQRAIADVLDTCDSELRLLRVQRSALDEQKRGLMQQLLTGRLRVKAA
jgi:type I restriction enzyme S subunit